MATPMSPGWYPAPDGNGEQWWNGAGWSDGRRNPDGTTPGLPGYQAAPPVTPPAATTPAGPVPLAAPNPYGQRTAAGGNNVGLVRAANNPALIGIVFSALSLFVFAPLGIVGIVMGIIGLRKPDIPKATRGIAIGAIALGALGLVIGIVELVVFIVGIASVSIDG